MSQELPPRYQAEQERLDKVKSQLKKTANGFPDKRTKAYTEWLYASNTLKVKVNRYLAKPKKTMISSINVLPSGPVTIPANLGMPGLTEFGFEEPIRLVKIIPSNIGQPGFSEQRAEESIGRFQMTTPISLSYTLKNRLTNVMTFNKELRKALPILDLSIEKYNAIVKKALKDDKVEVKDIQGPKLYPTMEHLIAWNMKVGEIDIFRGSLKVSQFIEELKSLLIASLNGDEKAYNTVKSIFSDSTLNDRKLVEMILMYYIQDKTPLPEKDAVLTFDQVLYADILSVFPLFASIKVGAPVPIEVKMGPGEDDIMQIPAYLKYDDVIRTTRYLSELLIVGVIIDQLDYDRSITEFTRFIINKITFPDFKTLTTRFKSFKKWKLANPTGVADFKTWWAYEGDEATISRLYITKKRDYLAEEPVSYAGEELFMANTLAFGLTKIMDGITANKYPNGGCCWQFLKENYPAEYKAMDKTNEGKPMLVRELTDILASYKINYAVLNFQDKIVMHKNFGLGRRHRKYAMFKIVHSHIYPVENTRVKKRIAKAAPGSRAIVSKHFKDVFDESDTQYVDNIQQEYLKHCEEFGIITRFNMYAGEMMSYSYAKDKVLYRVKKTNPEFEVIKRFMNDFSPNFIEVVPKQPKQFRHMTVSTFEDAITKWGIRSTFNDRARDIIYKYKCAAFTGKIDGTPINKEDWEAKPKLKSIDINKAYGTALWKGVFYAFDCFSEFVECDENMEEEGIYICECKFPLANVEILDIHTLKKWGDVVVKKTFFMKAVYVFTMPRVSELFSKIQNCDLLKIKAHGERMLNNVPKTLDPENLRRYYTTAHKFMNYTKMDAFKYFACNLVGTLLKKTQNITKCHVVDPLTSEFYISKGFNYSKMKICDVDTHVLYEKVKKPMYETGVTIGHSIVNGIKRGIWDLQKMITSPNCKPLCIKTDEVIYEGEITNEEVLSRCKPIIGGFRISNNVILPKRHCFSKGLDMAKLRYFMYGSYGNGIYINGMAGYAKSYTLNQTSGEMPQALINGEIKPLPMLKLKKKPIYYGEIETRCAFTNMSAELINGITIHKLLGLRKGENSSAKVTKKKPVGRHLIIDEISQIKPSLWNKLYLYIKMNNLKVILSGDPHQINECANRGKNINVIISALTSKTATLTTYKRGENSPDKGVKMLDIYDKLLKQHIDITELIPKAPSNHAIRKCICRTNHTRTKWNEKIMSDWVLKHGSKTEHIRVPRYNGQDNKFKYYSQDTVLFVGTPVIALFTKKTVNCKINKNEEGVISCLKPLTVQYPKGREVVINDDFTGFIVNWAITGIRAQGQTYDCKFIIKDIDDIKKGEGARATNYFYTCISRATNINNVYLEY